MGVVDDHGERLSALDPLHPAGHPLQRGQPRRDGVSRKVHGQRAGGRRRCIVQVEAAGQAAAERQRAGGGLEDGRRAVDRVSLLFQLDVGRLGPPERPDPGARSPAQLGAVLGIGGKHGVLGLGEILEQLGLGLEVVPLVCVEIEMVPSQVEEGRGGEPRTGHPRQRKRV